MIHFRSDSFPDEDMYLFTGVLDDFTVLPDMPEGELHWVDKDKIMDLPLWEGDKVFLKDLTVGGKSINYTLKYKGEKLIGIIREV